MLGELLVIIAVMLVMLLGFMPLLAILISSGFKQDPQAAIPVILSHMGAVYAAIGGFILAVIIGGALGGGLVGMFAKALKGKTRLGVILDVARKHWLSFIGVQLIELVIICLAFFVPFLVLMLMGPIGVVLGLLLGLLAVIVMGILLVYAPMAVAINGMKAMDAVRYSIRVGRASFWKILTINVIFMVVNMVVGVIPVIGSLVAMLVLAPMQVLSLTSLYLKRGQTKRR
jgi:hypothetical protein